MISRPDRLSEAAAATPLVCVVDDDARTLARLDSLARALGFEVRAYADARRFLAEVNGEARPRCLIIGGFGNGSGGREVIGRLVGTQSGIASIVVTADHDVDEAVEAMHAGATDVVARSACDERFRQGVERGLTRARAAHRSTSTREAIHDRYATLTRRERDVVELVISGYPSRAIADRLHLQVGTVEVYRSRINRKMGARNAADLTRMVRDVLGLADGPADAR